jgi:hypothetical protein
MMTCMNPGIQKPHPQLRFHPLRCDRDPDLSRRPQIIAGSFSCRGLGSAAAVLEILGFVAPAT